MQVARAGCSARGTVRSECQCGYSSLTLPHTFWCVGGMAGVRNWIHVSAPVHAKARRRPQGHRTAAAPGAQHPEALLARGTDRRRGRRGARGFAATQAGSFEERPGRRAAGSGGPGGHPRGLSGAPLGVSGQYGGVKHGGQGQAGLEGLASNVRRQAAVPLRVRGC